MKNLQYALELKWLANVSLTVLWGFGFH